MHERHAFTTACVLGCLAGVALTAPALATFGASVPDTQFSPGQLLAAGIGGTRFPWISGHVPELGWPFGAEFRPFLWPVGVLAAAVGGIRAVTLSFALAPVINALGGWAFARSLGLGPWSAVAAAGLTAFNPWVHNTLANGQVEQAVIGGTALMWATAMRAARGGSVLLAAATAAAVGFAAPHVALAGALGLPVLALTDRAHLRRWLWMAVPIGAALWFAHGWHGSHFGGDLHVFLPKRVRPGVDVEDGVMFERASLARLLVPPAPAPGEAVVHAVYLGWVLLAAAVTARAPRVLALAAVLVALATGPLTLLGAVSTTVETAANPYRLVTGVVVALSAAAAGWAGRGPVRALALVGVAWAETALLSPRPLPLGAVAVHEDASSPALARGSGAVLDLPVADRRCEDRAFHYIWEATRHGRPVPLVAAYAEGAYGWSTRISHRAQQVLSRTGCAEGLSTVLREAGIATVVLHDHEDCRPALTDRACLTAAFGEPEVDGETSWWNTGLGADTDVRAWYAMGQGTKPGVLPSPFSPPPALASPVRPAQ